MFGEIAINRIVRTSLCLSLTLFIVGCPSVKLLNANQEFVTLMQQSAEAERLRTEGTFDQILYDFAMEELLASFAANGDEAVKNAEAAKTAQSQASLFNVAVRNYLQSGALREGQIDLIAREGIDACSSIEEDLDKLPTTCGYFHIVVPQAVNNEWQRSAQVIVGRVDDLAGDEKLSVEEGKTLVTAADQFFKQLDALKDAKGNIDFASAGENLMVVFTRQQDIFFCNAQEAVNTLDLVEETGEEWNRDEQQTAARVIEKGHSDKLKLRPGGLDACP